MIRSRNLWPLFLMILAMIAVVVFGAISYVNTTRVRAAEQEIAKAQARRAAIERLQATIYGTESFHRGFLVTGEQQYFDDYRSYLEKIDEELATLQKLVDKQPEQLARVDNLDKLVKQRKNVLAKALDLKAGAPTPHEGTQRAGEIIADNRSGELHDVHSQMLAYTDSQMKHLEQEAIQRAAVTKNLILLGNALAIGLAVLAMIAWRTSSSKLNVAQLEKEKAASELTAIFKSASEGIMTFGTDLQFRYLNPAAEQILRVNAKAAMGTSILDFVPKPVRESVSEKMQTILQSDVVQHEFSETTVVRNDGAVIPIEGTLSRTKVDGDDIFTLIFTDLSKQKQLESTIEQQSQLFDQVQTPIHICDMEDKVVFWNLESERTFGITKQEALGKDIVSLIYAAHAQQHKELRKSLLEQNQIVTEWQLTDKDQTQIAVEHRSTLLRDWEGKPSAQLMIDTDITERKKSEVRIQRAQRLESIGTLAGGIAHDLNNVLSPILMAAKLLKRDGVDHHKLSDTIVVSAERCTKMISKLLAFAGGESSLYAPINIAETVKETESILGHALPKHIELTVKCADNLHPIKGDATEISQVLMNLAINARDAMPDGGALELRVENATLDDARAAQSQGLKPGDYVRVSMSDTGEGIAPEVIDKIFDPFFTTKEQDKGTGLGLATTLGIVRKHNGEVLVYSEPEHGTTFTIYLPAHGETASHIGDQQSSTRGNGQTILLVDDESLILETAQAALELHGYNVLTASGGAEALVIYQHQQDKVELLILDVMMPGMDGLETRDSIRSINPNAKIIATSGLRRPGTEGSRMNDVNGFLAKPYSDDQLFELVARVLICDE